MSYTKIVDKQKDMVYFIDLKHIMAHKVDSDDIKSLEHHADAIYSRKQDKIIRIPAILSVEGQSDVETLAELSMMVER